MEAVGEKKPFQRSDGTKCYLLAVENRPIKEGEEFLKHRYGPVWRKLITGTPLQVQGCLTI